MSGVTLSVRHADPVDTEYKRSTSVSSHRFGNVSVQPTLNRRRRMTMDEKRITRLVGLSLGGVFAISLILSAISL